MALLHRKLRVADKITLNYATLERTLQTQHLEYLCSVWTELGFCL